MSESNERPKPRPSINVQMTCCQTYVRIYLTATGDAFAGHCPRCAMPVRVRACSEGSKSRFFRA